MTDEDYIRAAVELADGFEIVWEKMRPTDFTHIGFQGCIIYLEDPGRPQFFLDALAAQLVRQVDAAGSGMLLCIEDDRTSLMYPDFAPDTVCIKGPDRTMNTIRVIVDSGVLK